MSTLTAGLLISSQDCCSSPRCRLKVLALALQPTGVVSSSVGAHAGDTHRWDVVAAAGQALAAALSRLHAAFYAEVSDETMRQADMLLSFLQKELPGNLCRIVQATGVSSSQRDTDDPQAAAAAAALQVRAQTERASHARLLHIMLIVRCVWALRGRGSRSAVKCVSHATSITG